MKLSGGQKRASFSRRFRYRTRTFCSWTSRRTTWTCSPSTALADALTAFEGGVVLITHDAHICSKVLDDETSEIWVVDDGVVTKFNGDFEDYRDELVKEMRPAELDAA